MESYLMVSNDRDNHTPISSVMEEEPKLLIYSRRAFSFFTGIFLIAILFIFPLYYRDYYFDILNVKYRFYYISVLAMATCVLVTAIVLLVVDLVQFNGRYTVRFFSHFTPKNIRKTFTVPDVAMACFLLVATISTLLSDYLYEAFWGNEGRFTGLFLLLVYGISFYIISKLFRFKSWFLDIFLAASMLVCLFGITDFFQMNLLHFKDNISPKQYSIFTSTLGNINTYTAFVSLTIGVSSVLFASEKKVWKCIWYYVSLMTALFAIITGQSDNAYLALLALFGLLPLYMFRSWSGIKRYAVILASFFSVIQIIDWISQAMAGRVLKIEGIFSVLVRFSGLAYIVIALWVLVGVLYLSSYVLKKKEITVGVWPRRAWAILVVLVILAGLAVLYDANMAGNGERYGALKNYVVIDDEWGTHRGYIWRIGLENYKEFPLIHKIFGYGPDTFGIVTVNNNYDEMVSRYNEIFDSAHNEYLQYFVTIGPFGLISYLVLLVSAVLRMVRRAGDNPYVVAAAFSVVCYGAQAFVNINLPIATPVMWTLMMVGLAGCREGQKSTS